MYWTVLSDLMQREGAECLPIVLVNGEAPGDGASPRREELARAAGLVASASQTKPRIRLSAEGCCTPGSACSMQLERDAADPVGA